MKKIILNHFDDARCLLNDWKGAPADELLLKSILYVNKTDNTNCICEPTLRLTAQLKDLSDKMFVWRAVLIGSLYKTLAGFKSK
jgi:hypothetical protein